ncbi:MAG: exodeoxyribonuclease VII small subunit [Armatimonadetes bacterium]|nr:exodeoxyribonuclease VII small subunit [Armatimonadota bacterium]MDE2206898.1 exodeoxyribonuclease VII small subunit [Armatimonadota bacterium]
MTDSRPIKYTEAMAELQEILRKLETGEEEIDTVADSVKRAAMLIRTCRERLRSAEQEVDGALRELEEDEGTAGSSGPTSLVALE